MTITEFADRLRKAAPEAQILFSDHLAEYDVVLPHLLVARIRDLAIAAFERGDRDLAGCLVAVFDEGLRTGDDEVENAVAVSFVEDSQWWDPARRDFIESWPVALQQEAHRQQTWNG